MRAAFNRARRARGAWTAKRRKRAPFSRRCCRRVLRTFPGSWFPACSVPARAVGGDWYDFIPFPDGRWGLVLADVSGKGTAAALLMSATRGVLRSLAEACCTPGEVLARLNQLLVDDFPGRQVRDHGVRRARSGDARLWSSPMPGICCRCSSTNSASTSSTPSAACRWA